MNDEEVIISLVTGHSQSWMPKATLMKLFYTKRHKLGRTGKTKPLFYIPFKAILDKGLVEEKRHLNKKWVQKVDSKVTEYYESKILPKTQQGYIEANKLLSEQQGVN